MKRTIFLIAYLLLIDTTIAQNVGIGTTTPHPSAQLEVSSTSKGFLPPRMTYSQRNGISNPAPGLIVYCTDCATSGQLQTFDGTTWLSFTLSAASGPISFQVSQQLTTTDRSADSEYGFAVSISGDYAIVGSRRDDIGSVFDQGSAFIFVRNGNNWLQQTKLTASDGAAGDLFGSSVNINGDYAIIGAPQHNIGNNSRQGAAYVFVRSGSNWVQQAKLSALDGGINDFFGNSVSVSGDHAIVGASDHDIGTNFNGGAAYVFVRNGTAWIQQTKLIATDVAAGDRLGCSVGISGDYAVVGARTDDIGTSTNQGSAYIFARSGSNWTQQVKLTASDGAADDRFGCSVSISGDYVIVGAFSDDKGAEIDQGAAYVFTRSGSTWTQQAKLTALDGAALDEFGYSVSISGDYLIVGARADDINSNREQGSAYVFIRSGTNWIERNKITALNGTTFDSFGFSVGISGNFAVAGAFFDDSGRNPNQGSAYIIQRN